MFQLLRTLAALSEDPGLIPSLYSVILNDLELQSQGLPNLLLASVDTAHIYGYITYCYVWYTYITQEKTQSHKIKVEENEGLVRKGRSTQGQKVW